MARAEADPRADDGDDETGHDTRGKGRRRRIAVIAGITCALAILIGLGAALIAASAPPDRSSPEATTQGYFNALKAQDYASAWQYVADSRNNVSSQSSFIAGLRSEDSQYGRVTIFTLMPAQSAGATQATVQVTVTRSGAVSPDTTSFTVVLTQYDGGTWLITNITAT